MDERRQFRVLYRDFLSRIVDLELIAAGGDARGLIVRFGSMLGALSFVLAYLLVPRYATSGHTHARLVRLAWSDEEFLISATITVAGLCAVMAWNTVFPDRRDSLILGLIPVRMRILIAARMAAIATVLGAAIGAINLVTGFTFPFALSTGAMESVRSFVTWWLVLAAAGTFTFSAGLAVQGIAAQLLPWRFFLRVSGLLQLAALFAVLAAFFLAPPFGTREPPAFVPSFWFVGLLHELRGDRSQLFVSLAAHAWQGLGIVVPLATILYILSWSRNVRRIVESPEILPARRTWLASWLARLWSPAPFERGILLFTARTMARSRQHRLMLAIYGGFAFALSLAYSRSLLTGTSTESWNRPNVPLLITGILLLSCAVVGTRAIFALPLALPANWIFAMTAVHRPGAYFSAVRKSLYTFAALPVWIVVGACYLAIWPGRPALEHVLVLALLGIVLVERSLYQFRKIPFTCSWLPGTPHSKMRAGTLAVVFLLLADIVAAFELWTAETAARMVVMGGILGAVAVRSRYRTSEFAADPGNRLQFEHLPPAEIFALDLKQDGNWSGDEAYVEAIDPAMGRGLAMRMRPFAIGAVLLVVAGLVYERAGEWRDHRRYPQIGRSVDIGGRSLNLSCVGSGSPAVIFESGSHEPGASWIPVQRQVARVTRACWYDRAGYGWSDPAAGARTSEDIAEDLHKLLGAAGIGPPYVLAGHGTGGFDVRVYADRYRQDVAGMVLVDPADEFGNPDQAPVSGIAAAVSKLLARVGIVRLLDEGPGRTPASLSRRDFAIIHSLQIQSKALDASMHEGLDREQSMAQVRSIRSLGDLPLVVLRRSRAQVPDYGAYSVLWGAPDAVVDAVREIAWVRQ